MNSMLKRAFLNAVGVVAYVIVIVLLISSFQRFSTEPDNTIIPIAMILLFVFSAAITGYLVFGKPIMLYTDGKKKEAVSMLSHTLAMLALITIVFFISLLVYYNFN